MIEVVLEFSIFEFSLFHKKKICKEKEITIRG